MTEHQQLKEKIRAILESYNREFLDYCDKLEVHHLEDVLSHYLKSLDSLILLKKNLESNTEDLKEMH